MISGRITDYKYAQLQSIINTLDETALVSITDPEGIIKFANKKFCAVSGYSAEELIGKRHNIIKSDFHPPEFFESMWNVITNGLTWRGIIKNMTKDGSYYWVKTTIIPEIKDGEITQYVSIRTDITEQKNQEERLIQYVKEINLRDKKIKEQFYELEKRQKEKNEFIAIVSHELKTYLSSIIGYCDMLNDLSSMGPLNDNQSEAIGEITLSSERLQVLINEILTVQKIELDQLQFHKKSVNLTLFMQAVYMAHMPLIKKEDVLFVNSMCQNITLETDERLLMEVFSNLIHNAVDFIPKKGGRIEISVEDKEDKVLFYVKDNGIGISKQDQKNLFEKFYQVDTSFKRKFGGTGLGLAICAGIVEKMGGKIWVDSDTNKGCIFYFELPKIRKTYQAINEIKSLMPQTDG